MIYPISTVNRSGTYARDDILISTHSYLKHNRHGIQLASDTHLPQPLIGHNKGASYITVLHEAFTVGQVQVSCNLDGSRAGAIWDRADQIDVPTRLPEKQKC